MKRGLALLALAAGAGTFVANPAATQEGMNHAAVVIDTGDGVVRKMCLAFSEAELSGIEALRRVDTRPNRFETFSGKGSGVCMLCGVGCASGDCFCDPSKYWAYHRAGPGETSYRTSSLGASSTVVRDGDVEAWKWGTGSAPAKASVSEVCGVPEPPARTTSGSTTTSTTTSGTPTTGAEPPTSTTSSVVSAPSMTAPGPSRPGITGTPTTRSPASPTPTDPGDVAEAPPEAEEAEPSATTAASAPAADEQASDGDAGAGEGGNFGQIASLAAFSALLGGLLLWRARLRKANRRGMRPVR